MIIKKDESTGQLKFICEINNKEFSDIEEFRKHTESLFKEKSAYLIELIQNECSSLDNPHYSNIAYFSYEVNRTMTELSKLKKEYNSIKCYILDL